MVFFNGIVIALWRMSCFILQLFLSNLYPGLMSYLLNWCSLLRMQTDYIDLYQIHWPDRFVCGSLPKIFVGIKVAAWLSPTFGDL